MIYEPYGAPARLAVDMVVKLNNYQRIAKYANCIFESNAVLPQVGSRLLIVPFEPHEPPPRRWATLASETVATQAT